MRVSSGPALRRFRRRRVRRGRSRGNGLPECLGADLDDYQVAILAGAIIGLRIEEGSRDAQQGVGLALLEGRCRGDLGRALSGLLLRELVRMGDRLRGAAACGVFDRVSLVCRIDLRRGGSVPIQGEVESGDQLGPRLGGEHVVDLDHPVIADLPACLAHNLLAEAGAVNCAEGGDGESQL